MTHPDPHEHFKPVNVDISDGIYRVVGSDEGTVTLLRVADANERRIHTGEVVTVSLDEFTGFTPAENPDGNRPLGATLTSHLEMGYWSIRVFLQQLASNLIPATIAMTLVIVGVFGDQILSLPDVVFGGLILLGSLGLAFIGGGRL
ncbi:hypothetical protein [Halorarius halobius]|uniref:hypothetical protein n=1 Tax=Halorarius halobius TaxID=2962671 RepID=UPI0020CD7B55|nr:hypothetical protein [Halorarius halobius]